jgi:hypothetical protein
LRQLILVRGRDNIIEGRDLVTEKVVVDEGKENRYERIE